MRRFQNKVGMAKNLDGDASVVHVIVDDDDDDDDVDTFFRGVGKAALDLFFFSRKEIPKISFRGKRSGLRKKTDVESSPDVSASFQFRI